MSLATQDATHILDRNGAVEALAPKDILQVLSVF